MTFEWPRYNDGWEREDVKAFFSNHPHREIEQHLRHVSVLSGFEDLAIAVESDEQAHNMVSELLDLEALLGNSISKDSSEVHAMVTKFF